MDFSNQSAEDVLVPSVLPYYRKGIDFFHLELVHLNVNIFILDYVLAFPFGLFVPPGQSLFFRMVFSNFFDSSVLVITRVATDHGAKVFTLPRFRNRIRASVRAQFRAEFDSHLRKLRFDSEVKSLLKKATVLRDSRLAHTLEDNVANQANRESVRFGELKSLRDSLNSLLDGLGFNTEFMMLPLQYDPRVQHPKGTDSRPDIERLLDDIAHRSSLLNLPELRPERWLHRRRQLSAGDIYVINSYRQKFGLDEV